MSAIYFSSNLQKLRKSHNYSQEDLAEKLQISRQAVAKWENDSNYPDILNLTMLADIFGITVDALIYGNNCSEPAETLPGPATAGRQMTDFLLRAKKCCYAGNGEEEKQPCRPSSHDFLYEEDNFLYIDSYLGSSAFTGEEVVWAKEQRRKKPIWSMNYFGRTLADSFPNQFLKEALSHVEKETPFRGPLLYRKGEYVYHCAFLGDLQWFRGREEIYYGSIKVYECEFHGGAVE